MVRFTGAAIAVLATASLIAAAPLDTHHHGTKHTGSSVDTLSKRKTIAGTTYFFSRADCTNPCVENGLCLSGQTHKGNLQNDNHSGQWSTFGGDRTCWDVPAGTKSVSLTVGNDHGYWATDVPCDELSDRIAKGTDAGITWYKLGSGDSESGPGICNGPDNLPQGLRSIAYAW